MRYFKSLLIIFFNYIQVCTGIAKKCQPELVLGSSTEQIPKQVRDDGFWHIGCKLVYSLLILFVGVSVCAETLQAGISVDSVPDSFYGSWRVTAKVSKQSGSVNFKPQTVDFWNLSRTGDVINLNNPFTGADASVKVNYVEGNMIRFTKTGRYDTNKILTDTVDLKLSGDTFTGINSLVLETYSQIDGKLMKTDTAIYVLKGEKVSGVSITGK